jgi:anti-sigma factor RsiW
VSFGLRPPWAVGSRHIDAMLSAYADRSLPAGTLLACDRHVAICPGCREAVDAERRLLSSLRTAATPALSSRLESALLDLAVCPAPGAPRPRPLPLAVVGRSAPAMHRSPVRAAMLASLAAGASAAAAWSVGVSGVGPVGASQAFVHIPSRAAVATSSRRNGSSSQAASLPSTSRAVAGMPGPIELSAMFALPSNMAVPVAQPLPGAR